MELKQIKELMSAMEKAGIKKLSIKEKTGYELHLERQSEMDLAAAHAQHPTPALFSQPSFRSHEHHPAHFPHPATAHSHSPETKMESSSPKQEKEGKYITSPMVGTFYATPSPDDPVFVKVGDKVDENTVVCIVEAMKVMNEVKAGISGVVAEICLDNGHPVEFGTKLFRIV